MKKSEFAAVQIKCVGESGVVIEFGTQIMPELNRKIQGFTNSLRQAKMAGIFDIVPAYCSVTVYFDPLAVTYEALKKRLQQVLRDMDSCSRLPQRLLSVPVCYGGVLGPDLDYVARTTGLSAEEVIQKHIDKAYLVYMLGFTPGFAYLGGLPEALILPRQSEPRSRVPVGSVGIGGGQTGFYPVESPGEWWLIGRTPLRGFDARRTPPFLLEPGDYVQFSRISQAEYFSLRRQIEAGQYKLQLQELKEAKR